MRDVGLNRSLASLAKLVTKPLYFVKPPSCMLYKQTTGALNPEILVSSDLLVEDKLLAEKVHRRALWNRLEDLETFFRDDFPLEQVPQFCAV